MKNKPLYDIFISGKSIDLIAINENLIINSNYYKWFNDSDTTKYMQQHYYPNTIENQLDFYKRNISKNKTKLQLGILHKETQTFIGVISLSNIDFLNRSAEISGLIGEAKHKNFTNFLDASKLIIIHAFESLNLNRIYGGTITKEVDVMFCKMLGFKKEGISRNAVFKNNIYFDIYKHSILKHEYMDKIKIFKKAVL